VLVDQIAAGEVVERPASVVKELLDNSLDAGAKNIQVIVAEGGTKLITVSDDGHGMDESNARLAIERHATSKLRELEGLHSLKTLGFRGEALASIASVSHFRLITRTQQAPAAVRVSVDGGVVNEVVPAGAAPGTTVEVHDLFYNVPARRKFLRAQQTESAHIADVCLRAILGRPDIRLVLKRGSRVAREFLPAADLAERVRTALPRFDLEEFRGERKGLRLDGFLSRPEDSRSGSGGLHLFVNGRPVRERRLSRAVSFAYGSRLPAGRYPSGAIFLTVDPALVDVNVHPQKTEVRFERGAGVLDSLTRLVASGMGTAAWSKPEAGARGYWAERVAETPTVRESSGDFNEAWGLPIAQPTGLMPSASAAGGESVDGALPRGLALHSREDRVWVCDIAGLLSEHWQRAAEGPGVGSEALLLPVRVDLGLKDCASLLENEEALGRAGFALSSLGPETIAVQRCPLGVGDTDLGALLRRWGDSGALRPFRLADVIRIAAKLAVEAGAVDRALQSQLIEEACVEPEQSRSVREHLWSSLAPAEWDR